jgi:hypothetical protein
LVCGFSVSVVMSAWVSNSRTVSLPDPAGQSTTELREQVKGCFMTWRSGLQILMDQSAATERDFRRF